MDVFIKPVPGCCIYLTLWEECSCSPALLMRIRLIPKSLYMSLDKGENSCMMLVITRFYFVLISEAVRLFWPFQKIN